MTRGQHCRGCGAAGLQDVLDHGNLPLADGFPDRADDPSAIETFPVRLALCEACGLAQLRDTVPRTTLFGDEYPYLASCSTAWLEHGAEQARRRIEERGLDAASKVVEIASNDGYLLQFFAAAGVRTLGIEPAPIPAAAARERGIDTREAFFDGDVARDLVAAGWAADLILANNVLAHSEDLHGLVAGVRTLLKPEGLAVFEFGYLADLFDQLAYDTLYHEHLCVFSLRAVKALFEGYGLAVIDAERIGTQGGSLRVAVAHRGPPSPAVAAVLAAEDTAGLALAPTHRAFAERVRRHAGEFRDLLEQRRASGRRVAAYGAPAKGTTLLNVCGIDANLIDYAVDRNPRKQGRQIPGTGIPIEAPDRLRAAPPDDLVILPWNLRDEILAQETLLAERGTAFILPLPAIEVVS
ncbi:MAG: class I SAM-dependent methyltransferase [Pseudomonadota bacterium]